MKRREFIALIGGAATWPLTAQAQQPGNAVIGFLGLTSQSEWGKFVAAFQKGLGEAGYVEGRNLTVEYRWAEGHYDRLPAQAADLLGRADRIAMLAQRQRLPTIFHLREPVAAGGLMSYGASFADAHRQAGVYVGRILKGEKPSDLPVLQPTKFDLVINLKAAKALGLTVPDKLLALADEVIE
jgi:hypothetical protein